MADAYLRERCAEGEIGTLIAEDVPEMRNRLRGAFEVAKRLFIPAELLGVDSAAYKQGISQIQDGIHFAEKVQAPLLQIADACAFCLRRFFSEQSHGAELVHAMGLNLDIKEWIAPFSAAIISGDPRLRSIPYPLRFPGDG